MCSAFQPGVAAQLIWFTAQQQDCLPEVLGIGLQSAGEDIPSAYRTVPVLPEHIRFQHVAARNCDTQQWWFFETWALLFGFSSAVTQFTRWSKCLEALCRRVGGMLVSMYVDDLNLVDLCSAKGHGQSLCRHIFQCLGVPLADDKRLDLASSNPFLGVMHDFTRFAEGVVTFWPKGTLCTKLQGLITGHQLSDSMTPAESSKFRGVAGFMAQAMFGRIGRAAMGPFKKRQYSDQAPWQLSWQLIHALEFCSVLLRETPYREVWIRASAVHPLIIASDAQAEPGTQPTGGAVLVDPVSGFCSAICFVFTQELLELWDYPPQRLQEGGNPIALCEAAAIPIAIMHFGNQCRGRDVVWFVDNTAALHSMVKGCGSNAALDRSVYLTHLTAYRRSVGLWFEYVDSESNWSDGVSRELENDKWCRSHCIPVRRIGIDLDLWRISLKEAWVRVSQTPPPV
jgi:hypothetical protein